MSKSQIFARLLALGIGSTLALSGAYLADPWDGKSEPSMLILLGLKRFAMDTLAGMSKRVKPTSVTSV